VTGGPRVGHGRPLSPPLGTPLAPVPGWPWLPSRGAPPRRLHAQGSGFELTQNGIRAERFHSASEATYGVSRPVWNLPMDLRQFVKHLVTVFPSFGDEYLFAPWSRLNRKAPLR